MVPRGPPKRHFWPQKYHFLIFQFWPVGGPWDRNFWANFVWEKLGPLESRKTAPTLKKGQKCTLEMPIFVFFFLKRRPNHDHDHFWAHLAGPIFHFWVTPRWRTKCPLYTVEHTEKAQRFFIWCAIKCRFGVASDAKLFWKIMVVVVFGPSPYSYFEGWGHFLSSRGPSFSHPSLCQINCLTLSALRDLRPTGQSPLRGI